jgi:hypothetical protein
MAAQTNGAAALLQSCAVMPLYAAAAHRGGQRRERRDWGLRFGVHQTMGGGRTGRRRCHSATAFEAHQCGMWSKEGRSKGWGGVWHRLGVLLRPFYRSGKGRGGGPAR